MYFTDIIKLAQILFQAEERYDESSDSAEKDDLDKKINSTYIPNIAELIVKGIDHTVSVDPVKEFNVVNGVATIMRKLSGTMLQKEEGVSRSVQDYETLVRTIQGHIKTLGKVKYRYSKEIEAGSKLDKEMEDLQAYFKKKAKNSFQDITWKDILIDEADKCDLFNRPGKRELIIKVDGSSITPCPETQAFFFSQLGQESVPELYYGITRDLNKYKFPRQHLKICYKENNMRLADKIREYD